MRKTTFACGFCLAVFIVLLKYLEYSYFIKHFSIEFYIGIIALAFLIVGIWTGVKRMRASSSQSKYQWSVKAMKNLDLTMREMEVLIAMAEGLSNKQIAEKLHLIEHTVKTYASNLYSKLNVNRRTQALKIAKELKMIE